MVMRTRIQLGFALICCIFFSDIRRGLSAPISSIPQHGAEQGWSLPSNCTQPEQERRDQELTPGRVQNPPISVLSCLETAEFLERQQARPASGVAGTLGLSCGGNRLCNEPMWTMKKEIMREPLPDYSLRQQHAKSTGSLDVWTPGKPTPLQSVYEGVPVEAPLQNLYAGRKIPVLSDHQTATRVSASAKPIKTLHRISTQTWFNLGLLFLILERLLSRI